MTTILTPTAELETTSTLEAFKLYEQIVKPDEQSLDTLAEAVNDLHAGAQMAAGEAINKARRCGEFLIQIKKQVGHGKFVAWVEANTNIPARTARRYMMLARGWELLAKTANVADLPIVQATKLIARAQRQPKYVPLTKELADEINEKMRQDRQEQTADKVTAKSIKKAALANDPGECISEIYKTVEKLHEVGPEAYREIESNVLRSVADKVDRWNDDHATSMLIDAERQLETSVSKIKAATSNDLTPPRLASWHSIAWDNCMLLRKPAKRKPTKDEERNRQSAWDELLAMAALLDRLREEAGR